MSRIKQYLMEQEDGFFEEVVSALKPFAMAYKRIEYYNQDGATCSDDATLQAEDPDTGSFELFADEGEFAGQDPQKLLSLGHIGDAARLYDQLTGKP